MIERHVLFQEEEQDSYISLMLHGP
jgi:hypothetical protein